MSGDLHLTDAEARRILGVARRDGPAALRKAFREHAKRTHPDRPGGDAAAFQRGVEAFQKLQAEPAQAAPPEPVPCPAPAAAEPVLTVSLAQAFAGGAVEIEAEGRRLRVQLPPGLRDGEALRVDGRVHRIAVAPEGEARLRGDDLWITAETPGVGRLALDTPAGPRVVWIDRKAVERGLMRLAHGGLPARGSRPAGALYVRLRAPGRNAADSPVRALLRRFAEAWAA